MIKKVNIHKTNWNKHLKNLKQSLYPIDKRDFTYYLIASSLCVKNFGMEGDN